MMKKYLRRVGAMLLVMTLVFAAYPAITVSAQTLSSFNVNRVVAPDSNTFLGTLQNDVNGFIDINFFADFGSQGMIIITNNHGFQWNEPMGGGGQINLTISNRRDLGWLSGPVRVYYFNNSWNWVGINGTFTSRR